MREGARKQHDLVRSVTMQAGRRTSTLGALALAVGLLGCPGFGDQTLEDLAAPPEAPPSWDDGVAQILAANCGGCHTDPPAGGAPPGFRLDKYTTADVDDGGLEGAFEKRARIFARVVSEDPSAMPPGGGLSLELRSIIGEWVMSGAPRAFEAAP